ncbi:MAG: adaptor protein MecA [Clostridia bacterium]|nr:adaptor protein MecA [Clostridia bacterium]
MELILISSSKLKIMLSETDMKKYALDAETADYDDTATRRAFWSILDDVKNETGFNAAGDRVFIQLYPSKEGGCEMFVTKMGLLCAEGTEGEKRTSLLSGRVTKTSLERLGEGGRERIGAYVFDELSSLLSVCRQLYARKWRGKSEAYRGHDGKCYLLLCEKTQDTYATLDRLSFISEYGQRENADNVRLYIREHADCICQSRAVQTLGVL